MPTETFNPNRMTTDQAAEYVGYSPATLANWRTVGKGPEYHKPAGKVFYRKAALDRWLENCKVTPEQEV